jgi:hypothetical protein
MNNLYIIFLIWGSLFSHFFSKYIDAFFLKHSSFGRKTNNIKITMKEIENSIVNFNITSTNPTNNPISNLENINKNQLYEKYNGKDMHILENWVDEYLLLNKILENNKKMELLKILESVDNNYNKIEKMNHYSDFVSITTNEINGINLKNGGLMDKWKNDDWPNE